MTNATRTRKKSWRSVAGSLATLLALLAAPFCAPLCAARTCSQTRHAASSEGQCHAVASMHDDVPQIHAALNCNPVEVAVAALSPGYKSSIIEISRSARQADSHLAPSQEFYSGFIACWKNLSTNPGPLRPSDLFSAIGVLRI